MATLSHEMRLGCQKLIVFWDFTTSGAIFSHETRLEFQKLMVFCDFTSSPATLSHETRFECQKLFFPSMVAPAARNEVRMTKTESFLRLDILGGNPFARIECQKLTRNEVRVSKTEGFCDFTFSAATLSYEMRFECQKLKVFCDFGWSGGNAFAVCV